MKNLFLIALVALSILSCSKETPSSKNPIQGEISDRNVKISFGPSNSTTKSPTIGTDEGETWEKTVTSMSIYIFKEDVDKIVAQRKLTDTEIAALEVDFVVPNCESGKKYTFYAVANKTPLVVTTKTDLLATVITDPEEYNSEYTTVTAGCARENGFVMSGSADATINETETIGLIMTLDRIVSKVAIQAKTTDIFASNYNGAIRVNKANIEKSATDCLLIKPTPVANRTMTQSITQASTLSEGFFKNLFYLYENASLTVGNRVNLKLEATYDADKDFTTTDDQQEIIYNIELEGSNANGVIERNAYYKLNILIDGLTGKDVTANIIFAPWNTVETSHNVGQ